jgi:uncharacterized MnhB-related membrane protein
MRVVSPDVVFTEAVVGVYLSLADLFFPLLTEHQRRVEKD